MTTLEIESRGEPADRVTLSLPRRVQVESILYEGLPVNARSRGTGDTLFWDVELPDPLIGPGRTLQVTGTTAVTLETDWDLPVVDVEGSQLVPRAADSSQPSRPAALDEGSSAPASELASVLASAMSRW